MTGILQHSATHERSRFADAVHNDGYGVIRGAIGRAKVEQIRLRFSQILAASPQPSAGQLEMHVARIVEKHPDFTALAVAPPLLATLTELFGTMPHLVASYGHVKPARTSAHTGIHSDIAHLHGVPHHASTLMVKVMYALTPVRQDSGATLVYPGTHRLSVTEQARRANDDGVHVRLEPGDVQLFHANLMHTATANESEYPRLSLWFVYAQPWMRAFPDYEYTAAFLDGLRPQMESEPVLADVFGLRDPYSTR